MHREFVVFDLGTEGGFDLLGEGGEVDVGDLAAAVAEKVVVRLGDLVKAIGNSVDVQTVDQTRLVHGVEVVVDGCHGNAGHLQLGKKKDLVGGQMAVGLL